VAKGLVLDLDRLVDCRYYCSYLHFIVSKAYSLALTYCLRLYSLAALGIKTTFKWQYGLVLLCVDRIFTAFWSIRICVVVYAIKEKVDCRGVLLLAAILWSTSAIGSLVLLICVWIQDMESGPLVFIWVGKV
jgi:hypothetical protein